MTWVWDNGPSDPSELLVMLALADFANDSGECWPAMSSVAEKARMSERGVQKIIRRMEETGAISITTGGGRGGCNRYVINTGNPERETGNTKRGMAEKPRTGVQETPNGSAETPNRGSPEPSRTLREPSNSKVRDVLLGVLSEKTADDFIAHRRAIRKRLTERAAELVVSRLAGCSDPDAVVNRSIMNGWQGVFPDQTNSGPQSFVPQFDLSKFEVNQ